MKSIFELDVIKAYIRMCNDGWLLGWHERNGGNCTYRMTESDVLTCRPYFREKPGEWVPMGYKAKIFQGNSFFPPEAENSLEMLHWHRRILFVLSKSTQKVTHGESSGVLKKAACLPVNFLLIS